MESLKLFWLGSPRIELKGRLIRLETRKATALMAYLSLSPNPCPREVVATLFWPDGTQQRALGNLRRALSSMNARLPGWIEADHDTLGLKRNERLWVDVFQFRQALEKYRSHCSTAQAMCDACLLSLLQAAEIYAGDFLEGLNLNDCLSFDEWQFFQRDSLRQELGASLHKITIAQAHRDRWEDAIFSARRWVALDRLNEAACRQLMDLYARSGQVGAARREYDELVCRLQTQTGQEPEQETRCLFQEILGRDDAEKPASPIEPPLAFPLLKTKLYMPSAPAPRVIRTELLERLEQVEHKSLTVISAPAGFGKTTLLAEWVAHTSLPVAWLSLDQGENDPYRFLNYLTAALDSIHEQVGENARLMMQSMQLLPAHIILASLINDLSRIATPYVVVLDDYQFISEHAVHEAMAYLLDHLPTNMHLVIATRADPPLQLGRLRANWQLLELRTRDLRFNLDETAEFLNEVMRLELGMQDIEAVEARTEGWVVGLKMAALSLKGHENAGEFIRAFSGSHRFVLDYLMEEVLKRQPAHIQSFLLRTSILSKFNSSLCEALMGAEWKQPGGGVQQVIEYLEKSNLFLIQLDDHQDWYRYHHLFADLLQSRLRQFSTENLSALNLTASLWFENRGSCAEALFYAIQARDFLRAAELIERNTPQLLARNEFSFYREWLDAIPAGIVETRPWLAVYRAWLYARLGQIREIEPLLQPVENYISLHPEQAELKQMAGCIALVRANIANLRGNFSEGIHQASKAEVLLSSEYALALDNVRFQRGFSLFASGDWTHARELWTNIAQSAKEARDYDTYTNTMSELPNISKIQGRLHEAYEYYKKALDWLHQEKACSPIFLGSLQIGAADTLREWNRLGEAERLVLQGLQHAEAGGRPNTISYGRNILAHLLLALNDLDQAELALDAAENVQSKHALYPRAEAETSYVKIRIWAKRGKTDELQSWLERQESAGFHAGDYLHELTNLTRTRALLAIGQGTQALELLGKLEAAARQAQRNGRLVEILVLRAMTLLSADRQEPALKALTQSLTLARPEAFVRIFLDEGEPMICLLQRLKDDRAHPELDEHIDQLLGMVSPR